MIKKPIFEQIIGYPTVHCATLSQLSNASLVSAWFGGAYETAPDVDILMSVFDGAQWSEPYVIASVEGKSMGQPIFLHRPDGELWLFFDVIMDKDWTSAVPYWQRSTDGGRTWLPPQVLLDHPGLMFRSNPILFDNRIILPAYDENTWQSLMVMSDDDGQTWELSRPIITDSGNIHPCLVKRDDGSLLAYLRTGGRGGYVWRTMSTDGGETWQTPTRTHFPNPNSCIDLIRLQIGNYLLAFNNSESLRTPLCVALADADENWQRYRIIEDDYAEYSYPTLRQTPDGMIHMVYTARRQQIHHAQFTEEWLLNGASTLAEVKVVTP